MKCNPNKGYTNDWMDFNRDGASYKRRIKGKDKKYMQRLTRHRLKRNYFKDSETIYEEGDE